MTRRGDPLRVIVYLRVSTEEQLLGPEVQLAACEAWASAHGAAVVGVFRDLGVGGATAIDRRPELLAALDALRTRRAGVLLAAKRDRFARDVIVAATLERLAERAGAEVVSADGAGAGSGPEAQLYRHLLDAFAQYERGVIRLRTRGALAALRRRGRRYSGAAPIGSQHEGQLLLPDVAERAAVVAAQDLRARGFSLRRICSELAARGHVPRGKSWHLTTVARMLRRE